MLLKKYFSFLQSILEVSKLRYYFLNEVTQVYIESTRKSFTDNKIIRKMLLCKTTNCFLKYSALRLDLYLMVIITDIDL